MKISFSNTTRQEEKIRAQIDEMILNIINQEDYIYHPVVYEFEHRLAKYLGVKHVVTVASGTDALILALKAAGIGPGDEVITSAFSFFSTAASIAHVGGIPVFVDIDPTTFNINVELIEQKINENTKAILPVHLFGQSVEMDKVNDIAKQQNLLVIEDAAQSLGAKYNGNMTGTMSLAGCLSFNCSKNLGAFGNGGAVVTNDDQIAKEVRLQRNYGLDGYFHHTRLGINSNITAIQAGVLSIKLQCLNEWNEMRNQIADFYSNSLSDIEYLKLPSIPHGNTHVFHKYTVIANERERLQRFLKEKGIETKVFYPESLPSQPCFNKYVKDANCFNEVTHLVQSVISLPIYPGLTSGELFYVVECIKNFYSNCLH